MDDAHLHERRIKPAPNRPLRAWCAPRMGFVLAALGLWALLPPAVYAADSACRCAPQPLAEYFERAQVVLAAEVVSVEDVQVGADAPPQRIARVRTLRSFKNAAGLGDVRIELGSTCGSPALEPGERYWIFGTQRPAEFDVWIGACDGSRTTSEGFADVEADEVAEALQALAKDVRCKGPAAAEIARKIRLEKVRAGGDAIDGLRSPNGAYAFTIENPSGVARPPRVAILTADHERDRRLRLSLHGVADPVRAEWINEKLIYVRVSWSRTLRTDIVLDVEAGAVLVADSALVDPDSGRLSWLESDCTEP